MNLLEEILLRAQQAVPAAEVPVNMPSAAQPHLSLIERLTGQRMNRVPVSPFPPVAPPAAPQPPAATAPPWQAQAGILAPGITGPDSASARAPVGPLDPNYVTPNAAPTGFMTPGQRNMQELVDPEAGFAPRAPLPQPRPPEAGPREADGSMRDDGAQPHYPGMGAETSTDVSARGRGGVVAPSPSRSLPIAPTPQQLEQPEERSLFGSLGGFGSSIMSGLKNNSNTLLALGAGFAGAPNIGQGISRAAAAAIPASQQDLKNRTSLQGQGALYRTLVDAGVPKQQALAAMSNPELAKRLMEGYVSDRKREIKTVKMKDAFGNEVERIVAVNPYDPADSVEVRGGGTAGGVVPGGSVPPGFTDQGFFAPGITQVDESKSGDEYMAQFSPRVQAAARSYIEGKSMPTGRQDWTQKIKTIAQKYGEDTGINVSDQEYFRRKKFQTDLASVNPNSVGGQVKAFRQGISHFKSLADAIEKYNPSGGLGIEPVAQGINKLGNLRTKNADIAAQINAAAQSLAGEVGKLFSGSTGGGVHERELTRNRFNAVNSGPASAGALESTLELMEGGLHALERQRDEVLGQGKGPKFVDEQTHKEIEHIREVVRRLRGEAKKAEAAPARGGAPAPGKYVYDPASGRMIPRQ